MTDEGFAYGRRYMRIRRMRRDRSADADPVSVFEEGAVHGDTSDEERACERQGELLREDAEGHLTREAADWWARYRAWRERRRRLLREQQERALEQCAHGALGLADVAGKVGGGCH